MHYFVLFTHVQDFTKKKKKKKKKKRKKKRTKIVLMKDEARDYV